LKQFSYFFLNLNIGYVAIVDNSPLAYAETFENAIPISDWFSDPKGKQLLCLIPFLKILCSVRDVRLVLKWKKEFKKKWKNNFYTHVLRTCHFKTSIFTLL
jgi:TFIIF-interacting CTD phosphatase-like protein